MGKKRLIEMPKTKGTFIVKGKVTGTQKEKFYNETTTKRNKPMRTISFGVEFAPDQKLYVRLTGMEQDFVYFSKKDENGKFESKPIPWVQRAVFNEEGYNLIGVHTGVTKVMDETGHVSNDKKTLVAFDACKEIGENLKDGVTVFVKGNIIYESYNNRRIVKYEPTQVSLAQDIDFEASDFEPTAYFTQGVVLTDMKIDNPNNKAIVNAKVVGYASVEDTEMEIHNPNMINAFKKALKPYYFIKTWGSIKNEINTEEVTETSCWGEENKMNVVKNPVKQTFVITGADPETIDKTTFSEEEMEKAEVAIAASKEAEKGFKNTTTTAKSAETFDDGWGDLPDGLADDTTLPWG